MSKPGLGRREALSGSLAIVLAAMPRGSNGDTVAHPPLYSEKSELLPGNLGPSAFQEAFLAWFSEEPKRFRLPVSLGAVTSTRIEMRIQGLHPAIYISIEDHSDINVFVEWEGVVWDQLLWLFADEEPCPDGVGWMDEAVLPEFQVIHPTREALWRENVFGDLLTWINEDLAHATYLAIWGSADHATWARLVRDGKVLRTDWTIAENGGTPTHFLQVHGYAALRCSSQLITAASCVDRGAVEDD
jgi:hypothetical protein